MNTSDQNVLSLDNAFQRCFDKEQVRNEFDLILSAVKTQYNPHLKFVVEGSKNDDGEKYQDEDDKGEKHRSTLRPDTIMVMECGGEIAAVAVLPRNDVYAMKRVGYIYGDWKNREMPYHKIACILLDMKSVMRNYAANSDAQKALADLILHLGA